MSKEERRTIALTSAVLLLASLVRFAWETRPVPPLLPPQDVPSELIAATEAELEREERMRVPLAEGETLDPNEAPDVELARLPGVGPTIAERIVRTRESEGAFRRPADLLRVPGIGPATLERIEPVIEFSDPPSTTPFRSDPGAVRDRGTRNAVLDLNDATVEELQALPGLGPVLSARIVQHRRQHGPFRRVEELTEVSGIGEATLREVEALVRVGR